MPVKVVRRGGVPRVVEAKTGRIARGPSGVAVDGGPKHGKGFAELGAQARAINARTEGPKKT